MIIGVPEVFIGTSTGPVSLWSSGSSIFMFMHCS